MDAQRVVEVVAWPFIPATVKPGPSWLWGWGLALRHRAECLL
jgi:hypothetical protein